MLLWKLFFFFFLGVNNKEKLSFFNTIYFLNEKRKGEFHAPIFKEKKFFSILFFFNFFFSRIYFFLLLSLSLSFALSPISMFNFFAEKKRHYSLHFTTANVWKNSITRSTSISVKSFFHHKTLINQPFQHSINVNIVPYTYFNFSSNTRFLSYSKWN